VKTSKWKHAADSYNGNNNGMVTQDRQCIYNVTMRRVPATIVVVEKKLVLNIVSVCL
jgi:hypothetical protein